MTEYKINIWKKSFRFDPPDTIFIASVDMSALSDNEILEYVSDSLTHEHVHEILYKLFGDTTTKLFDAIQQYFRNTELQEKIYAIGEITGIETYQAFIKREGFKAFLEYYHITEQEVIKANIKCNWRNINAVKLQP